VTVRPALSSDPATAGITAQIPIAVQWDLWTLIDVLCRTGIPPDYLQVFELIPCPSLDNPRSILITHHQEQPPYIATHASSMDSPIPPKIFVIDDGDHATMLLASEY